MSAGDDLGNLPFTDDPVIVIAGPTASGKSALALDVSAEFGGTVINADSMQVYRELRLLTARPTEEDEARVPHRLYGVLAAAEACSVGRWLSLAAEAIREARAAGRLPVVVGGTGLYIKALLEGLSPLPEVPAEVRAAAQARREAIGPEAFHAEVAELDPDAAARIPAADGQRLTRAWEVATATGLSLSAWQARETASAVVRGPRAVLALLPPREILNAAIDARFAAMVEAGALDEVRALLGLDLCPDLPAMKAVGVRELAAHLRGDASLDEAVAAGARATRQYAKRQMTWIRHQICPTEAYLEQYSESLRQKIFSFIRQFVLTQGL